MEIISKVLTYLGDFLGSIVFFNVFSVFGVEAINLPLSLAFLTFGFIFMCFKFRFVQFRWFGNCLRCVFKPTREAKKSKNDISSFKILLTAIASCTGMNATAGMVFMIYLGGPGTALWVPVIALLCMPFRFAEVYLSHSYRTVGKKDYVGGPFDYIKKGFAELKHPKVGKILSVSYAWIFLGCGILGLSMYEMNQSMTILSENFNVVSDNRTIVSFVLTVVLAYILIGGTRRVANFMSVAMPVLALTFWFIAVMIIVINYQKIPDALSIIFHDAIHPKSIAGGFAASFCMSVRKAALAHETGLGTSGMVHSSSMQKDSVKEATGAMFTPVINGILICSVSAFIIVVTGVYENQDVMKNGVVALAYAFGQVNKHLPYILTALTLMMTINVIVGWGNYCNKCSEYLFGRSKIMHLFVFLFLTFAFIGGSVTDCNIIVNILDAVMMILPFINVFAVLCLSGLVWRKIKNYKFK